MNQAIHNINTVIVSDFHLSESQKPFKKKPYWMAYKREEFFIDEEFSQFLDYLDNNTQEQIELVLNGDTFDFDIILTTPKDQKVDWLAELRGLGSEEWMSLFKIDLIIDTHPIFFKALKRFLSKGHKVVFIIGNHDAELYWPAVQERIRKAIGHDVGFCNWFYISGGDTYISHGHQYDPNCVVKDPISPLISTNNEPYVRIPFGDLAGRYVMNGMGYFNPHVTNSYIKSFSEYFRVFIRHIRTQPLIVWSWFWGAAVTMIISLWDHWKPAMKDPLTIEDTVDEIAEEANATPAMVRRLRAAQVPSACTNPVRILRELWLDRGILLLAFLFMAWQLILHINIALQISMLWFFVPFVILLPTFMVYSQSIKPKVFNKPLLTKQLANYIVAITNTERIVFSHTHIPKKATIGGIEYFNSGSWSPAFLDYTCKQKAGSMTFVWIKPGKTRDAELYYWEDNHVKIK